MANVSGRIYKHPGFSFVFAISNRNNFCMKKSSVVGAYTWEKSVCVMEEFPAVQYMESFTAK